MKEHFDSFDEHMGDITGGISRIESIVDQIGHQMRVTAIKVKQSLLGTPIEPNLPTYLMIKTVWSSEDNVAMIGWKYVATKKDDKDTMQEIRIVMMDGIKYLIIEAVEYNVNNPMDDDSIDVYQSWCEGLKDAQCHVAYILGAELPNQIVFE